MKKSKRIICILFICLIKQSYSQISGSYATDRFESPKIQILYTEIDLFKNGTFCLNIVEEYGDIISVYNISKGKYTVNKDTLEFIDSYQLFTISFVLNKKKLLAISGFSWLKDRTFSMIENSQPEKSNCIQEPKFTLISERTSNRDKAAGKVFKFDIGRYTHNQNGICLNLTNENNYSLIFHGINISEGLWLKNGNEIVLFDKNLKHPFFAFIVEKGLILKFSEWNNEKIVFMLE